MARLYILVLILRPFISRDRLEAPKEDIERIFRAIRNRSRSRLLPFKRTNIILLVANGQGLVAFATRGSIALACGDPIAPDELFPQAVQDYIEHCRRHGWTPCVYFAADARLPTYQALKLQSSGVAEEAIVNLEQFTPGQQIGSTGHHAPV